MKDDVLERSGNGASVASQNRDGILVGIKVGEKFSTVVIGAVALPSCTETVEDRIESLLIFVFNSDSKLLAVIAVTTFVATVAESAIIRASICVTVPLRALLAPAKESSTFEVATPSWAATTAVRELLIDSNVAPFESVTVNVVVTTVTGLA